MAASPTSKKASTGGGKKKAAGKADSSSNAKSKKPTTSKPKSSTAANKKKGKNGSVPSSPGSMTNSSQEVTFDDSSASSSSAPSTPARKRQQAKSRSSSTVLATHPPSVMHAICPHIDLTGMSPSALSTRLVESALRVLTHPPTDGCVFCRYEYLALLAERNPSPSVMYTCLECTGDAVSVSSGCWHDGFFHLGAKHFSNGANTPEHSVCAVSLGGPGGFLLYCGSCRRHVWTAQWQFLLQNYRLARKDRLLKQMSSLFASHSNGAVVRRSCRQVRGLLNLGQTCFMGAVLQCLLHDAHLQRHFLSGQQASTAVHARHSASSHLDNSPSMAKEPWCVACELDRLFQLYYRPSKGDPVAPINLFTGLWQYYSSTSKLQEGGSSRLIGYDQQDAHELLVELLHLLHVHLANRQFGCDCVVHATFAGVLESSVQCQHCEAVNVTYDPFLDLSLELPPTQAHAHGTSLLRCLDMFSRSEPVAMYACGTCHTLSDAARTLRIRKLPRTLVIHVKRYSPTGSRLATPLIIPRHLSMYPYTNQATAGGSTGAGSAASAGAPEYRNRFAYQLSSVVCHHGDNSGSVSTSTAAAIGGPPVMTGGHYTAYIGLHRSPGNVLDTQWFACNDEKVSLMSREEEEALFDVDGCPAYLLFYNRLADDHDAALL